MTPPGGGHRDGTRPAAHYANPESIVSVYAARMRNERSPSGARKRTHVHAHRLYPAAICPGAAESPAGSTLAAENLNSGILPNGSSAGLVRTLAAAST